MSEQRTGLNLDACGYVHAIEDKGIRLLVLKIPGKDKDGKPRPGWLRWKLTAKCDGAGVGVGDKVAVRGFGSWNEYTAKDGSKRAEWQWVPMSIEVVSQSQPREGGGGW